LRLPKCHGRRKFKFSNSLEGVSSDTNYILIMKTYRFFKVLCLLFLLNHFSFSDILFAQSTQGSIDNMTLTSDPIPDFNLALNHCDLALSSHNPNPAAAFNGNKGDDTKNTWGSVPMNLTANFGFPCDIHKIVTYFGSNGAGYEIFGSNDATNWISIFVGNGPGDVAVSGTYQYVRFSFNGAHTPGDPEPFSWYPKIAEIEVWGNTGSHAPVSVTGIKISPTVAALVIGQSVNLSSSVSPINASNQALSWSSTNPSVATVNYVGSVNSIASGSCTIMATSQDGNKVASCKVTVTDGTIILPARIEAENYISMSGIRTEGCADGGLDVTGINSSDFMDYKVVVPASGYFTLDVRVASGDGGQLQLRSGSTVLTTIDIYSSGFYQDWSTFSSAPFSLPAGAQKLQIFATSSGWNINWIEFKQVANFVPISGLSLSPTSVSMQVGENTQLTANITPANTSNKSISWLSSDDNIAYVDKTGLIVGIAAGTATITATSGDGSKTATCTINITSPTNSIINLADGHCGSTSKNSNNPNPCAAFDGDITTSTGNYGLNNGSTYLIANLGAPCSLSRTVVYYGGVPYVIDASTDGKNWIKLSNPVCPQHIDQQIVSGVYQYVRFKFGFYNDNTFHAQQVALNEIQIWGSRTPTIVHVTGVSVNPSSLSEFPYTIQALNAVITPSNASNKVVIWKSSNTAVAAIDANGIVSTANVGTAEITATSQDGNIVGSTSVTVNSPSASMIPAKIEAEQFNSMFGITVEKC